MTFTTTGGNAIFTASGSNVYEINFEEGTNDQTLNSGQVELQFISFNGSDIDITVLIEDLETVSDCNNTTTCPTPKDPDYIHTWIVEENNDGCPSAFQLVSPNYNAEGSASTASPYMITLDGSPGLFSSVFIGESAYNFSPLFALTDVHETWLSGQTMPPTSASQVLDMFINETSFAGGGFILNSVNQLVDEYGVSLDNNGDYYNVLPLSVLATNLNPQLGFCFQHDYTCEGAVLHSHYSRIRFSENYLSAELGETSCP